MCAVRMSVVGESATASSASGASSVSVACERRVQEATLQAESLLHEPLDVCSAPARALRCAEHVYTKLCIGDTNPLPVKSHRSAVQNMLQLRNLMCQSPDKVDRSVRMLLLYAGVSVQRRIALGSEGEERFDLTVTLALLFVLQVLGGGAPSRHGPLPEPPGMGVEFEEAEAPADRQATCAFEAPPQPARSEHCETIQQWCDHALVEFMQPPKGDWDAAMRLSPSAVCRACICDAERLGRQKPSLHQLSERAHLFFHCSALAFQYSMLDADVQPAMGDCTSFLTLSSAEFMTEANPEARDEKLAAIVDAAESEAGQQVHWLLNRRRFAIAVRRLPLLPPAPIADYARPHPQLHASAARSGRAPHAVARP